MYNPVQILYTCKDTLVDQIGFKIFVHLFENDLNSMCKYSTIFQLDT